MTKEQINIAIAESQGWKFVPSHDHEILGRAVPEYWEHDEHSRIYNDHVADYCNDLNAIHEVIKTLDTKQQIQYADVLCRQTGKELLDYTGCYYPGENPIIDMEIIFLVHNSTALQRAEAYLRTIGKWKDE